MGFSTSVPPTLTVGAQTPTVFVVMTVHAACLSDVSFKRSPAMGSGVIVVPLARYGDGEPTGISLQLRVPLEEEKAQISVCSLPPFGLTHLREPSARKRFPISRHLSTTRRQRTMPEIGVK